MTERDGMDGGRETDGQTAWRDTERVRVVSVCVCEGEINGEERTGTVDSRYVSTALLSFKQLCSRVGALVIWKVLVVVCVYAGVGGGSSFVCVCVCVPRLSVYVRFIP